MKKFFVMNGLLTVCLALAALFAPVLLGIGAALAVTGVVVDNIASNQDWNEETDWNEIDFKQSVQEIGKEVFFLTEITNNLNKTSAAKSIITGVGQIGINDYFTRVSTTANIAANTALTGGNLPAQLLPSDLSRITDYDVLQYINILNAAGEPIQVLVQRNNVGGLDFKVTNPDGTEDAPTIAQAIPAGTYEVMMMGKALNEVMGKVDGFNILPSPYTNYCQKFMETVIVTERALKQKKTIDFTMQDYVRETLRNFKIKREQSRLSGIKGLVYDKNGHEVYISNGLINQAKNTHIMSGTANADYFLLGEKVFGNLKSTTEAMMICGAGAMSKMLQIQGFEKSFNNSETIAKLGVKVKSVETAFGTIMPKVLPTILTSPDFYNKALFLDPSKIATREFTPFTVTDLLNTNNEMVEAKSIWEESCVLLEDPTAATVVDFSQV